MYFRRKVLHGEKLGRKLGFPTLNFHVGNFREHYEPGVYVCEVLIQRRAKSEERRGKKLHAHRSTLTAHKGALYFGPKGKSSKHVLEVHLFDFSELVYGQFVRFSVGKKIRGPMAFNSLESLKKQIDQDVSAIMKLNQNLIA